MGSSVPDDLLRNATLLDPAVQQDPTAYHHALHSRPIHFDPRLGCYICSSYALMRTILRDTSTFSSVDSQAADSLRAVPDAVQALRADGYPPVNTLVTNDPPSHTRFRRMVDDAFRPKRIEGMAGAIRQIVDDTIDRFIERGRFDAVADLAIPVPVTVIADMLGLERSLAERIKIWSDASVEPLGMMADEARLIECARLIREFQDFIAGELEQRRQAPRDDLLTSLVTARDVDGAGFSVPEMLSLTQQFLVAGNETTTNGIAAGVRLLIEQPELAARLRANTSASADEALLKVFVNEVLRLESPVQGLFRIVTRAVTVAGVELPAGSRIMLRFAAANRDPEQYAGPDRLDLERSNAGTHLAFGAGIHHCIGASLAREEMFQTFDALLQRTRSLTLRPGQDPLAHHPSLILRGLKALPVDFQRP